jgi:hypothetical protein
MRRMWIKPSSVAIVLAASGVLATSLTAAALVFPDTPLAASSNLAPVWEARADGLARTAASDEAARRASVEETERSIAQAPANPTAWLRLAYLDSLAADGLGPAGDRALAASYSVAPYGPDVTDWRLAFAFNHWEAISGANRQAALDELRSSPNNRSRRDLLTRVANPAGRIALSLTLDIIRREAALSQPVA